MILKMLQAHGLKNGLRRFSEEIMENRLFDIINGVETAGVVTHTEFYDLVAQDPSEGAMWYQPTYKSPLIKACKYLRSHHLPPQKKLLFVDLGTGKGKPCIIAAKCFKDCKVVGIDLSQKQIGRAHV